MLTITILCLIIKSIVCGDLNVSQDLSALPRNGFQPSISTVGPIASTAEPVSMLPTPAKQTETDPEEFENRIGTLIDTNDMYKDFMGIPLQQQTQTQTQNQAALSEATMQIAQTIISQIKNQAFANQNQHQIDSSSHENVKSSLWNNPSQHFSASFPEYMASNLDRRYGSTDHKPYDYKAYSYKPFNYKSYDYKHYDDYKPQYYKHHDDYKHQNYKHDDEYKHHDYKHDYKAHDDYKHHDYKAHDDYKYDYKDNDYKQHDENKIKAVIDLFKDFKDEAKKASHNLGKKVAEETKELVNKLGPIVPVAGTLLVGSLAIKLLTRPGSTGYKFFNKYQNSTAFPAGFPLATFTGRKKRNSELEKSNAFIFDEVLNIDLNLPIKKSKVKRSVPKLSVVDDHSLALNKTQENRNSAMHYKLVLQYENELNNEIMKEIETKIFIT